MPLPFQSLFQKLRSKAGRSEPSDSKSSKDAAPIRPQKREGERLSKTVLPSTNRPAPSPDPLADAPAAPASVAPVTPAPVAPAAPAPAVPAAVLPVRKAVPVAPRARDLPPALARALEPSVERAISLQLSDFIEQIPADYIKPIEVIDATRTVDLKASEIEKGMAERKPSISLPSLYQQLPEIFLREVPADEATRIALPYEKVLEGFNAKSVRSDQVREARIPQLDTPILQTTIEDTKRFGTKLEPLEMSEFPPLAVEPATAKAIAAAEPDPVARETIKSGTAKPAPPHPVISLGGTDLEAFSKTNLPKPKPKREPPLAMPGKIPFNFPPNGTGAPASERVPASSGPPVPTTSPPTSGSVQIPFNPPQELAKSNTSSPGGVETGQQAGAAQAGVMEPVKVPLAEGALVSIKPASNNKSTDAEGSPTCNIRLALKLVLKHVHPSQINGDINAVDDNVCVEFPLSLIEPQLASGRVAVPAKTFQQALPESHRTLFVPDAAEIPVTLPLPEVLKNLPAGVLKMRADQEIISQESEFETQFSLKAKEDAERFQLGPAELSKPPDHVPTESKPELDPQAQTEPKTNGQLEAETGSKTKTEPTAETGSTVENVVSTSPLEQTQPATDTTGSFGAEFGEKIDGKEVVARACEFPGVEACELILPDGLSLAGNFPREVAADALCAMAPMLLQRIETHMVESRLGSLEAVTVRSAQSAITFFIKPNVCLAALHRGAGSFASETRSELGALAERLSRALTQPEKPHVDN
jgi:predicted regulator of Ras-like GTPase activity (Roadblock/LC7/MglB family)